MVSQVFARTAKTPSGESPKPRFQAIFSDFDYDYHWLALQLPASWQDTTWKNNACPSYGLVMKTDYDETWYTVWFDYADPRKSEFFGHRLQGELHQFELTDDVGECIFGTNDWNAMIQFIVCNGVQNHYDNAQEARAINNG